VSILSNADLLRRVPLFVLLTESQAQQIANAVIKRRFKRGDRIVEQGLKSNALYIILSGRARVLASDSRGARGDSRHPAAGGLYRRDEPD